ncbi:hypothetical protein Sjap_016278 [Stephania japonica]|uniref:Uncharacterized protein n=1 Tax=Stephania japonica TaxID=461633 RepID=A0AAP0IMC5_9MAGN
MDGRSTIPSETRQAGIVIRSPQATVSLEDRLTAQEVQMTEVLRILRDQGAAISEMAASLTTEPSERQRLYPRLYEGNDRQGFASTKRQAGQSFGAVPQQRHTEVRDEGDQFDRQRQDQQGRQDRHPGQERGDEGHVVHGRENTSTGLALDPTGGGVDHDAPTQAYHSRASLFTGICIDKCYDSVDSM